MTDWLLPFAEKLEISSYTSSIFIKSHAINVSIAVHEGSCWGKKIVGSGQGFSLSHNKAHQGTIH